MKKLILHVGYPKTGTTSLQNSLFLKLNNKINYLGIAKAPRSDYHHLLRRVLRPWLASKGQDGREELNLLLDDRINSGINLMSEECFINSRNNLGPLIDPFEIKKLLLPKFDSIDIVIVIRNQVELIYALYANGGLLDKYGNILNTDDYINMCLNDKNYRPFFFFFFVNKKYKSDFGNNKVHVLYFEDFLFNKDQYYDKWAEVLNTSQDFLLKIMGDSHLHKKQKTSDGSYIFKIKIGPNKIKKFIKSIPFTHSVFMRLSKYKIVKNISLSANKRINKELKVELFNDAEKLRIKKSFFKDNLMLLKVTNSDEVKLKKYNYL